MSEVDELVESAQETAIEILHRARRLLDAGASPIRIHRRSVAAAVDLLEEVHVRAVLATEGDGEALARLGLLLAELERLAAEARAELAAQAGP